MKKSKRLYLSVSKIIRDYIPPEQSFDGELELLEIRVLMQRLYDFQLRPDQRIRAKKLDISCSNFYLIENLIDPFPV